jgi:hypothetical protein
LHFQYPQQQGAPSLRQIFGNDVTTYSILRPRPAGARQSSAHPLLFMMRVCRFNLNHNEMNRLRWFALIFGLFVPVLLSSAVKILTRSTNR